MASVYVTLNWPECMKIMTGPEMQADLQKRTDKITERANSIKGISSAIYEGDVQVHNRAVGMVKAKNFTARLDNSTNNTLIKALDAGRN